MHVYPFDRRSGARYDKVEEVTASVTLPSESVPPVPVMFPRAGLGHYVSMGARCPIAGDWRLSVTARVSDFDEYEKAFKVPIR